MQELRPTRADQSFLPDPAADPWSGGLLLSTRLPLAQDVFWEYWNWPRWLQPQRHLQHALSSSTPPAQRLLRASAAAVLFQGQSRALESGLAFCAAGVSAAGIGQRPLATDLLQRASQLLSAERSWYPAAVCTLRLAENFLVQSQLDRSAQAFADAAALAERSRLHRARALTQNGLGLIAHRRGEINTAAAHYEAAGKIWQQIGDRVEAFKIAHNLGGICYVDLNVSCAESRFRHALSLSESGVEPRLRANTQLALARLLAQTGHLRESLEFYLEAATSFARHSPDNAHESEGLGRAWRGLAQAYQALGEFERAQALGNRSLRLFTRVGHLAEANTTRVMLASVEREQGRPESAAALLAAVIDSDQPEPDALAAALIESASITAATAPAAATQQLQRARQLAPPGSRLDYRWWRARALVDANLGNVDAALAGLSSAEKIAQQSADLVAQIDSRLERIDLLIEAGSHSIAAGQVESCAALIAQLNNQVIGEDLRRAWSLLRRRLSELQMDLAAANGSPSEHHLSLLTQLDREATDALIGPTDDAADPVAADLRRSLRLVRERLASAPPQAQGPLLEEIHVLNTRLAVSGGPVDGRQPASRFGVADFPLSLPAGVSVLRFFVSQRAIYRWQFQDQVIRFDVIERDGELDALLTEFRLSLVDSNGSGSPAVADKLGQLLLGDIDPPANGRLIVVADRQLWAIPFAALRTHDARYLVEAAALEYAPSLASMSLSAEPAAIASMAIFADPEPGETRSGAEQPRRALPHARIEAAQLTQLLPDVSTAVIGADVTAERFLASLAASTSAVHFSGHGNFDFQRPERGGLWLAATEGEGSGYLHFSRLREVRSGTRLVVLNGCGTGVSPVHDAAGTLGFASEFHAAGVPAVVSTLWAASDSAAASASLSFHRALVAGEEAASALRQAQLKLLNSGRYRHPFYWAGYRLDRVRRSGEGIDPAVPALGRRELDE